MWKAGLLIIFLSVSLLAQSNEIETKKIKDVIQKAYVDGLKNEGDLNKIDEGFHKDFNLLGITNNNSLRILPIEKWKKGISKSVEAGKLPLNGDSKITAKFLNVDISGKAAVAKIELYKGSKHIFVDYFFLLKFDEGWKIVSKIYNRI